MMSSRRIRPLLSILIMIGISLGLLFSCPAAASAGVDGKAICKIADQDADYVLSAMERLKGKAILLPEVIAMVGVLRYAEASGNDKLIARVAALYKAAYINDGALNRLSSGHIESQATAIVPLELYRLTGDETLLKDCWRVVQGQMRGMKVNGAYRHASDNSRAQFIITMLQTAAHRVYGGDDGLKFAALNLENYLKHESAKGKEFFDNWKQWDPQGSLVGYSLADLERTLARDHPMRKEYNDQYVPTMGTLDQEGSLASVSAVELAGLANPDMKALMNMYRKIAGAYAKRLASGKMKTDNMFPFMQLTALAVGVRNGYLADAEYRKLVDAKWAEFAKDYKAPKLWSWNVVYKPLVRSGGRLLFAAAMLNLDKKPAALKTQAVVNASSPKRTFSKADVAAAVKTWSDLRLAEANDDEAAIAKIQKSFKFDSNNILSLLVEMELVRLTGKYDNERQVIAMLGDLLEKPLADKDINALIFAQAFETYGTARFAKAAGIDIDDSPLVASALAKTKAVIAKFSTDIVDTSDAAALYSLGIKANAKDADQMRSLCEKLQAKTGFFKHSIDSDGLCFSRASGQSIAGVTAFLKGLPNDHAQRAYFLRVFKNFAYAAERNQDGAGLWHVLPEDFNSPQDTLGSAFFVASLATGLEQKWIHRLEFREIIDLGWSGVQANVKGGKLANAVVASAPRKVASSYALLPRTASDALVQEALQSASAATESYYVSDVPGSKEDKLAVLGTMNELTAHLYEGKLADGRTLKHISTRASFDITKVLDCRGKKKAKIIQSNPGIYVESDFRLSGYEILDKEKIIALPDAIKKMKYPVAGITVWLEDNPSVHTVSDELGYCVLSMPYVALAEGASGSKVLAQIPGYKPISASKYRNYIDAMVKEVDDTVYSKKPEGPADKISGKLLAPIVLAHHRAERKELLAMLGKAVKEITIDAGVIMMPVYLRGKITSAADGKPVDEATVWLKRNPFMVHHACEDGEFEILGKDAALYEQTNDAILITAPHYKPVEISLKSYMNDNLAITMVPRNYNPVIQADTSIPMVRIPGGVFRMGQGLWEIPQHPNRPDGRDYASRNCWPIQTVSIPSFYITQYNIARFSHELAAWAKEHGYSTVMGRRNRIFFYIFANALSERDGLTPCYYTADLRVIRSDDDFSENMICNWRADGYRLPTWAEWVYASRAGRTMGPIFGDDADRYRDYYISARTTRIHEGHGGSTFARRMPLDWGLYGITLGQGPYELLSDFMFWRPDDSYHPRGPSIHQTRWADNMYCDGRTCVGRFVMGIVDNLETQWYDQWPGNPIGFQYSGYGYHLINGTFFSMNGDSDRCVARFVRTAENICNDIALVKTVDDPNLKNPDPVAPKTITAKLDMMKLPGGEFRMGAAFEGGWFYKRYRLPVGSSSPEHTVGVSPFSISKFELTVAQWREVQKWAKANGYTDLPDGSLGKSSSDDLRHPVVGVSWYDALKWCNAASEKAGVKPCYYIGEKVFKVSAPDKKKSVSCDWKSDGYRLPTEAEWEYASQAGSEGCFYWGDDKGYKYAWRGGRDPNSEGVTHPVGQKYGNRFGLYDTIGNVWEWTWDLMAPHNMNLKDQDNPKGPATKKEIADYIAQFEKTKKLSKELTSQKKYIGVAKAYHGGRTLKGCAYDTGLGYFNFQCCQFRVGLLPDKSDIAVGFRVVTGGDATK